MYNLNLKSTNCYKYATLVCFIDGTHVVFLDLAIFVVCSRLCIFYKCVVVARQGNTAIKVTMFL